MLRIRFRRFLASLFFCFFSFLVPVLAQEPVDLGTLFINSFSSSCQSGVFTQRALNDTNTLKRVIEQLKNDPACRNLNSVYAELISAQQQLDFYSNGFEDDRRKELEQYKDRLSVELALTTDPFVAASLSSELGDVTIQLLNEPYQQKVTNWENRQQSTVQLVSYIDTLNQNIADLSLLCFDRNKALPLQMAGQLLAISGGFFDPNVNLAVTLAGRLISGFFSFFENIRFNKKIADYRKTNLQAGLSCAMESLEQSYCDIEDRRHLIGLIKSYRDKDKIPDEWMGYELLVREYSTLRNFFSRVEAGSPPRSVQQGNQRAEFRRKEGDFDAVLENLFGLIGQAQIELLVSGGDQSLRVQRMARLVQDLMSVGFGSSEILRQVVPNEDSSRLTLWLRIGNPVPIDRNKIDNTLKEPFEIISELDSGASELFQDLDVVSKVDFEGLERNLSAVLAAARQQLAVERQITIIPDAKTALIAWVQRDHQGFSPEQVAKKFVSYFHSLEADWVNETDWFASEEAQRDSLIYLKDTRSRFETLLNILKMDSQKMPNPASPEGEPQFLSEAEGDSLKLSTIFDTLVLREKDQVITDRISNLVQLDLEKRLQDGLLEKHESLDVVARIGRENLISALIPGTSNRLEPLLNDLDEAEPIVLDNLIHFFEHYDEALFSALDHLKTQSERMREDSFGVYSRRMSELCALLANDPQLETRRDLMRICEGKVLGYREAGEVVKDLNNRPLLLAFDGEALKNQSPKERLCRYRRFRNRLELVEDILKQRPQRFYERVGKFEQGQIQNLSLPGDLTRFYLGGVGEGQR